VERMMKGDGVQDTSWSEPAAAVCHVQTNFEVLVPPETPIAQLCELARFTELKTVQTVAVLTITPARVRTAVSRGASAESLVAALRQAARHGVPPSVEHEILSWGGGASRADFIAAFLLRVEPERAAELRVDPRLAGWLAQPGVELAPGLFAINPGERSALVKALSARGISVAPTVMHLPSQDGVTQEDQDGLRDSLKAASLLLRPYRAPDPPRRKAE
jgi:hypothetical protein